MEVVNKKHISESFRLAALLALVGGFLDVYTYICRGEVFSNAQTGNMVLIGLSLAEYNFEGVLYHFLPVIAFILGVILTEIIKRRIKPKRTFIHWRQIIIGAEIVILSIMAFIPMGDYDIIVNVSISFICAMQVQAFRKVNGTTLSTTMCTGNLRTATEQMYKSIVEKDKNKKHTSVQAYGIVIFFVIGASMGGILTKIYMEKAILAASAILFIVFVSMFRNIEKYILKELEEDDEIEEKEIDSEIQKLK
ncbi:YoaK family protein [Intestinibacter sp.]